MLIGLYVRVADIGAFAVYGILKPESEDGVDAEAGNSLPAIDDRLFIVPRIAYNQFGNGYDTRNGIDRISDADHYMIFGWIAVSVEVVKKIPIKILSVGCGHYDG